MILNIYFLLSLLAVFVFQIGRSQPIGEQWLVQLVRVAGEHPEWQAKIQAGLLWFVGILATSKLLFQIGRWEYDMPPAPPAFTPRRKQQWGK
ncbi:hypothetical protein N7461_002171 [Penicillium sp. DV-2018c]|nr:hypothetical protein N7461_002171 [Penicillium sp. DV-2018c]